MLQVGQALMAPLPSLDAQQLHLCRRGSALCVHARPQGPNCLKTSCARLPSLNRRGQAVQLGGVQTHEVPVGRAASFAPNQTVTSAVLSAVASPNTCGSVGKAWRVLYPERPRLITSTCSGWRGPYKADGSRQRGCGDEGWQTADRMPRDQKTPDSPARCWSIVNRV